MAFIRLEGGGDIILRSSWAAHIDADEFGVRVLGKEGGITSNHPAMFHFRNGVLADEQYLSAERAGGRDPRKRCRSSRSCALFAAKESCQCSRRETLNVQRILNAAYESAEAGHEVETAD